MHFLHIIIKAAETIIKQLLEGITPLQKLIMSKFEYKVFDIDKVGMSEESLLNEMSSKGFELCWINNEPLDGHPIIIIKFYFKRKISFFERLFKL